MEFGVVGDKPGEMTLTAARDRRASIGWR